MTPNILSEVIDTVRGLNEEQRKDVLEYAKKIREGESVETQNPKKKKIWETIDEIMQTLPKEAFEGYPTDGSLNHDSYLNGLPKREQK